MDGDTLARQLAELGRQLDDATVRLAELDVLATGAGISAANAKEEYEDALALQFLRAEGAVETRKTLARLDCVDERKVSQEMAAGWEQAKAAVRNQQAIVRAINARIDIGRSLLSREKALAIM